MERRKAITINTRFLNSLHRIHETLLDLVEDHDAKAQQQAHEHETVDQPPPTDELAGPQEAVFEGLDDGGDGIEAHKRMDGDAEEAHAVGLTQRINDRRSVHPELDQEGEEDLEVAVFGGHRGDDGAEAQGQARRHGDQHREQQGVPGEMRVAGRVDEVVDQIDDQEKSELDAEAE